MIDHFRPALVLLIALTLLTGVAYPLVVTGVAQVAMPGPANGSLLSRGGVVVGSELIGQTFAAANYFHGRPSAAGEGNDAANSSGSNLGPTSEKLVKDIKERAAALGAGPQPGDLVTASASGLDPHISPAAALAQVQRVASARNRPDGEIRALVERHVEGRTFGLLGQPRVNVLKLNLALDASAR